MKVAKQIRIATMGIPGEEMNPNRMRAILSQLGFQPEHPDKPVNKRFLLGDVRANLDRVHDIGKPERHVDVEGLNDHSKAKVYYMA